MERDIMRSAYASVVLPDSIVSRKQEIQTKLSSATKDKPAPGGAAKEGSEAPGQRTGKDGVLLYCGLCDESTARGHHTTQTHRKQKLPVTRKCKECGHAHWPYGANGTDCTVPGCDCKKVPVRANP